MEKIWKRPSSVPYPQVWHKFTKVDKTGTSKEFEIEDLTEELFPTCVEFMRKYFIPDESLYTCVGLLNDDESVHEQIRWWNEVLFDKLSLVCKYGDEIVGIYILYHHHKIHDENGTEDKGERFKLIGKIVNYLETRADRYNFLQTDEYLDEFGLCVDPNYRGLGIATELLKVRIRLGAAVGLKVSLTVCTSIASQKASEKAGFRNLVEVNYSELEKMFPPLKLNIADTPTIRYMYAFNKT
ncbi:hypothetical protein FQR65_LT10870 [Abscondita terminalis]|nr:hypothetical protein FQR65_LT10870 [Abscondita terminalis]